MQYCKHINMLKNKYQIILIQNKKKKKDAANKNSFSMKIKQKTIIKNLSTHLGYGVYSAQ